MSKITAILIGALVIAVVLGLGVYYIFGDETGLLFARFIAVPAGLAGAGMLYLVYITVRKKKKNKPASSE